MWLVAVVWRCLVGCEHYEGFCPKHVETEVNNKHLIVASCWFFSLHKPLLFPEFSIKYDMFRPTWPSSGNTQYTYTKYMGGH
jgi:hypothetical protein